MNFFYVSPFKTLAHPMPEHVQFCYLFEKAWDLWLKIWYMDELHINHSLERLLFMMFVVGV